MDELLQVDCSPLTSACVKALTDRLEAKRKYAATQIEKTALEFSLSNNTAMIEKLVSVLGKKFCLSQIPNARKGGLIGLAATMVGYQNGTSQPPPKKLVDEVVPPILTCFQDPDSRVRYYACEALYNVIKVSKAGISHLFLEIFDNLAKVTADLDIQVRNGAEIIDKLLKDIVQEENITEVKVFVTKLKDYLYTRNPFTRMFVISWIRVLDSIESNMITHLPDILDGLLHCLYDSNEEVRALLLPTMAEFLDKVVSQQSKVEQATMVKIIEVLARELQASDHPTVKLSILEWFIQMRQTQPDVVYADFNLQQKLFNTLLETLSDNSDTVVKTTIKVLADVLCSEGSGDRQDLTPENFSELSLNRQKDDDGIEIAGGVASKGGGGGLRKSPLRTGTSSNLKTSKSVAISSSDAISISNVQSSTSIDKFMHSLYRLFREREAVFEERASFIIINLCSFIKAEVIYKSFASLLADEDHDFKFAYKLVQKLNEILLTARTLHGLRFKLRSASEDGQPETNSLFLVLFYAWCHSPIATLSICLLTNNYRMACEVVSFLPQLDITVDTLVEIDKLVQLVESPIFITMRLKLLDADNYYLVKSLYSLLMILPQSEAFKRLRGRLECVHSFASSCQIRTTQHHATSASVSGTVSSQSGNVKVPTMVNQKDVPTAASKQETAKKSLANNQELLKHFQAIQNRHFMSKESET